jgi:coatomer subunit delta
MEKLFLVLITTKSSNIIEDIEVIRQMQQVIVSQCQTQSVDERAINKKAFDLILCFDDIISNGYRESVTTSQIESYVEMESTDEMVHMK